MRYGPQGPRVRGCGPHRAAPLPLVIRVEVGKGLSYVPQVAAVLSGRALGCGGTSPRLLAWWFPGLRTRWSKSLPGRAP